MDMYGKGQVPPILALIYKLFEEFLGIRLPADVLKDCIRQKEWFKGVVLSTTFFEIVGKMILSLKFKEEIRSEKFERLQSVDQIIMLLFVSGVIDQPIYCKMIEVNSFRNDMVHIETLTEPKLNPKEAEQTINKAINCLELLMKKIGEDSIDRSGKC
jgi:hypothetical protein